MQTNDNQYYIYLRATKQRIPCAKEQFDDYYRDITVPSRTTDAASALRPSVCPATWTATAARITPPAI